MEFRNLTPFAAMQYAMLDASDEENHVVVMKVGYQLQPAAQGGYQLRVRDEDAVPLCLEDEFSEKVNASSVLQESDLAPFKPACDVIINATAWSAQRQPCIDLPVGIEIKNAEGVSLLTRKLMVTGERYFEQHVLTDKWSLSPPEPFVSYPLRWEGAFGGESRLDKHEKITGEIDGAALLTAEQQAQHPQAPNAPLAHEACARNPLGRGFIAPWYARAKQPKRYPAPRIFDPQHPLMADEFSAQIAGNANPNSPCFHPIGLGTFGRAWQPRLALAGTYDEEWLAARQPYLPADFDFSYWNCAPSEQQIPYPALPLSVNLEGVSPDGALHFSIPEHVAFILLRMNNGLWFPQRMQIDTLHIDSDRLEVTVCWRYLISASTPIRVMEARFETDPEKIPACIYPMLFPPTSPTEKAI
ncbi:DUF2169 family type VI secretion system accessory protein [Scandinavium lactucae]|uniref:DUF2169 domain-containing protein n=1 Tax=Scandinavium lactucae TaxID=3095028 RepID=A0ABU4QLH3_9ENTR|nr:MULTISPECIES: DUF2169 domain-containing protein [unclassified Scandinavium]MDX6040141.1 DUF2169 domain-containing protein [Scandinavium sp. V105_6]MDX6051188.1 DUF2169 domain-containing protein [Scandinavium sp. V105_1]